MDLFIFSEACDITGARDLEVRFGVDVLPLEILSATIHYCVETVVMVWGLVDLLDALSSNRTILSVEALPELSRLNRISRTENWANSTRESMVAISKDSSLQYI